ncbi:MAG: hypothetical protein FJ247_11680 [Nitrospira sp.]|nr:hypothetical protein [Nitrospira sp.]
MWLTKTFLVLATGLSMPLMLINVAAFPVAGIALGINGEWKLILWGIGATIALPGIYWIAMLPSMGIGLLIYWLSERERIFGKLLIFPFAVIGLIYNAFLYLIFVGGVFSFLPFSTGITPRATVQDAAYGTINFYDWDVLLWCYSTATAPFSYMASKEPQGNMATTNALFFVQLLAILFVVIGILRLDSTSVNWIVWLWFLAAIIIQGGMGIEQWRAKKQSETQLICGDDFKSLPDEVKNVLAELDAIEKEKGAEWLHLIKPLVVRKVVEDADKTRRSIKEDGLSPRTLAFLLILNVLADELTSGEHHIYRGVLSTIGHELLKLWDFAVSQQKLSGHYDGKKARKVLKWIRDEIKKAG